jgi:EAL domain-containing protein (putative c-di-GMP-specific phosphodiesterase class I)
VFIRCHCCARLACTSRSTTSAQDLPTSALAGRLPVDPKSRTLVSTIIGLAHAFDVAAVAEGLKTLAQLGFLIRESCDKSQRYLHSRPLPEGISSVHLVFEVPVRRMNARCARRANESA